MAEGVVGANTKNKEVDWQMSVYRYMSGIYTEDISLVAHSDLERQYTDNYLRQISYRYASNGINNFTSHASVPLKKKVNKVTIFARNNIAVNGRTF
jgi:hypothetical protein